MKTNWKTSLRRSRSAGLTLIEVVAAITILGTILVGVVIAKSRHTRQLALTQRRDAAVRAADELITQWWVSSTGMPINEQGVVPSHDQLVWQTRLMNHRIMEDLGAQVLRVEVRDATSDEPHAGDAPLVMVDLVLPVRKMTIPSSYDSGQGVTP